MRGFDLRNRENGHQRFPEIDKMCIRDRGHSIACFLSGEELEQREEELSHKLQKETAKKTIKPELCLDVRKVRKYFPVYKGLIRKKIGAVSYTHLNAGI